MTGLLSLGVLGVPWHTQILSDQLILFQPGGDRLCPPNYYCTPRFLDGPECFSIKVLVYKVDIDAFYIRLHYLNFENYKSL